MGVNNRQRRRAKKQKRGRDERARGPYRHVQAGAEEGGDLARGLLLAAAEAFRFAPPAAYEEHLVALAAIDRRLGSEILDSAVSWWVDRGLDRAWASGWQPADVVRIMRRKLSPAHAAGLVAAVTPSASQRPEARVDERWQSQVANLRDQSGPAWPTRSLGVETLSVLLYLPPLPRLSSASTRDAAKSPRHGALLERVRGLLAKAESTTFPEEAEALTAKAQELMARHRIDAAMVEAQSPSAAGTVVGWRIAIDDPYAVAKSLLLDRIAAASGCRAVWTKDLGFSTVFGPPADMEMVEVLFTSLLVQATEAMLGAGSRVDRSGRSRTRSFRQSFLIAYAERIGERLSQTAAEVVAQGQERHGEGLLPVLARRAEAVDEAVRAAFPRLGHGGAAVNNYAGWAAGRAAAEVARLAVGDELAAG